MPSVYLSHSNVDRKFAQRLADDLKSAGVSVWFEDFKPGRTIDQSIRQGIEDTEYFAFLASPNSVQSSSMALQELQIALKKQGDRHTVDRVLPLLLQSCNLPRSLKNLLYIDFQDPMRYQEALSGLLEAVGAKQVGQATIPQGPENERGDGGVLKQPLSPWPYAVMALAGLAGAVGLIIFYVYQGERIAQSGAQELVTLIVQILIALACAAFLFGTMKSTGIITSKEIGKGYTFGGPAALFIAVLGILVAKGPTGGTFDLTVRPHGGEGADAIISSGQITIDLGNDRRSKTISSNGEADFKSIPAKFTGTTVGVLAQIDGYKQEWQHLELKGDVLDLPLQAAPPPVTRLTGSIVPPPKNWASLSMIIDGQSVEGKADQRGRFDFQVTGKNADTVRLKIYDGPKLLYDDYQTLPGPVTLRLHGR